MLLPTSSVISSGRSSKSNSPNLPSSASAVARRLSTCAQKSSVLPAVRPREIAGPRHRLKLGRSQKAQRISSGHRIVGRQAFRCATNAQQPQLFFWACGVSSASLRSPAPASCCRACRAVSELGSAGPGHREAGTTSSPAPAAVKAPCATSSRQVNNWFGAIPCRRDDEAHRHARFESLLDHPNFLGHRPAPVPLSRGDNFNAIRRVGHGHDRMPHTY